MSESTSCNYCSYKRMKEAAKKRGETAFIKYEHGWAHVWYKDKLGKERRGEASFLELPDHCCC